MEKQIKLIILDTPGAERFHSIAFETLRHSKGTILVFDVTKKSSFDYLNNWLNDIKEKSPSI